MNTRKHNNIDDVIEPERPCEGCKGAKTRPCFFCGGSGEDDGKPCRRCRATGRIRCESCEGRGTFKRPDFKRILEEIKGRRGLRSKRPQNFRAYYVWRWARFHGGVDVTLPMVASTLLGSDPYRKELDVLAGVSKPLEEAMELDDVGLGLDAASLEDEEDGDSGS